MGEIGYFWKNADNQLPAEAGLVQQQVGSMPQKVFSYSDKEVRFAALNLLAAVSCKARKTDTKVQYKCA